MPSRPLFSACLVVTLLATILLGAPRLEAQGSALKLAVVASLNSVDDEFVDGVRLAVEEANAAGRRPRIVLDVVGDQGTEAGAREAAARVVGSDALAVTGPTLSTLSLAAGPIFAEAGLVSIVSVVESDLVTRNATTFHANFKNSDIGQWLAIYIRHVLRRTQAVVVFVDNGYGETIVTGFKRGAAQLGLETTFLSFKTAAERDEAGRTVAAMPEKPAIVLAMLDTDAVPLVTELRRRGVDTPILGGSGLADDAFAASFKDLPEEHERRGFFTKDVYGSAPVILDSANAATLAFAERFRKRFGQDRMTAPWVAVQGYDAGRLAVRALYAAARAGAGKGVPARRRLVFDYLKTLDSPSHSVPGLLGPIWFAPDRSRSLPVRIGRFEKGLFESAPVQLVPVAAPSRDGIAAGQLIEIGPGRYLRRQQVVYTGIYLNEISRIDVADSTFSADFYVWMRYAPGIATAEADPAQIEFPDMVRGRFDKDHPARQRDLDDGTIYRMWHVSGDFKNDFDLHRYPADIQSLDIQFFNARASSNRLIYVVDRSSQEGADTAGRSASRTAFRNLTQWESRRIAQGRDNLVTESAVGDPALVGVNSQRELSGFVLQAEVQRLIGMALIKTLLPLGLVTLIVFATLFFPPAMAAAKVTVAVTAGLSGAVLLAAINAQLGNVGYVFAVEYGFYVFFALCLTSVVTALVSEKWRLAERPTVAVDRAGRIVFVLGVLGAITAAVIAIGQWR
jgi:branched-chain amino acid transport system substrate-binding protein